MRQFFTAVFLEEDVYRQSQSRGYEGVPGQCVSQLLPHEEVAEGCGAVLTGARSQSHAVTGDESLLETGRGRTVPEQESRIVGTWNENGQSGVKLCNGRKISFNIAVMKFNGGEFEHTPDEWQKIVAFLRPKKIGGYFCSLIDKKH